MGGEGPSAKGCTGVSYGDFSANGRLQIFLLKMAISLWVWSQNGLPWQTPLPLRTRILAQCGEAYPKELDSSGGVVPMRAELWVKHRPTMEREGRRGDLHANPAP